MKDVDETSLAKTPWRTGYDKRQHAAVRTDDYVFSQLIPYIGNKRKLLPLIARGIAYTGCEGGVFADLFTGSTVVARMAKTMGFCVLANDWEPYSYEIARGTVAINHIPLFENLGGAEQVFRHLNTLEPVYGYVAQHLCPQDDENPDPEHERMFFTRQNGERIDAMREQIAKWESAGAVSLDERAYLLSALVYSVSYVSNTSGVFKGFHYGWGGKTGTALYRIRSIIQLVPPVIFNNGQPNAALREDAQLLTRHLAGVNGKRPDIVYIDPPYNQHPYGSNYHVLNTVTLWDKPELNPTIKVNGRKHDKSAIRKDWRTERRSPYNSPKTALRAFEALIDGLDVGWILVSYSTDGNMPLPGMITAMAARGSLHVFTQKYKRYRVSTPRMSAKPHNIEFLAVLDKTGKPSLSSADELITLIMTAEERALALQHQAMGTQLPLFDLPAQDQAILEEEELEEDELEEEEEEEDLDVEATPYEEEEPGEDENPDEEAHPHQLPLFE